MEKKQEEESDKIEKISCNDQSNRVQLSPHSHNVNESAKKMVLADSDKR